MLDLGSFELEIQKAVVIFEISTLRFVKYIKFCEKMEMSKCDTKNALFRHFRARILKIYYHI